MNFTESFISACQTAKAERLSCLSHAITLAYLSTRENGASATHLAQVAKISTAAMTGILDALEKLGLAERCRTAEDRRSVRIHITNKGIDAVGRMMP